MLPIVAFTGIDGFRPHSIDVVNRHLLSELRSRGYRVIPRPLQPSDNWKRYAPSGVAQLVLRYQRLRRHARRCWREFGDRAIYFVTDHANAVAAAAIPPSAVVLQQINDLGSLAPPEVSLYPATWSSWLTNVVSRRYKLPGLERADRVTTISQSVRQELIELLGVAPEKIDNIYLGVDTDRFRPHCREQARERLGLASQQEYVFSIAQPSPRKDVPCLLRAVTQLAEERPRLNLLFVGLLDRPCRQLLDNSPLAGRYRQWDSTSPRTLIDLYRAASVYVFPSHYEGFGLPAIEAMASGCPVIVADADALREVAGDAALQYPRGNPQVLADQLRRVLDDDWLRRGLVREGLRRAAEFSWDACGDRLERVIQQLCLLQPTKARMLYHRPAAVTAYT